MTRDVPAFDPRALREIPDDIKRTYGVKSRNQFVAAIVHDGGLHPS